jgi:hypothetical protein
VYKKLTRQWKYNLLSNIKIFNTTRMQGCDITVIVIKMKTVGLARERYNFSFLDVKFRVILSIPPLYRLNVSLNSFTILNRLYVSTNL